MKIVEQLLESTRITLQQRYDGASTIPGTRSFHVFIPNGLDIIFYKRTAEDPQLSGTYSFLKQPGKAVRLHMQDYAAVLNGGHWWIGLGN